MNASIFDLQFSTKETAHTLHHFNFTDWERNAGRDELFVIPRAFGRGRAGAEYGYAHLVERAIHVSMTAAYDRSTIKAFALGLFKDMERRLMQVPAYQDVLTNKLPHADLGFEPQDDRWGLSAFVHSPEIAFSENMISRDRDRPTVALFLPGAIKAQIRKIRVLDGDEQAITLKDIRKLALEMATSGSADDRARYDAAENAITPGLVDLTEIICRLDENAERTLNARPGYMKNSRSND